MALSEEARKWNEQQERYRENAHLHKHTAGADHKELMGVLSKIELSLGLLIDTIKEWIDDEEQRRGEEQRRKTYGYNPYRTPRSESPERPRFYTGVEPQWPLPHSSRQSGGDRNEPIPPYDPDTDPDRDSFDEGAGETG